jgi:hypothetical protein
VLANLSFGLGEALVLMGLFLLQFIFPTPQVRVWLAVGYLLLALGYLGSRTTRRSFLELFRLGWRASSNI